MTRSTTTLAVVALAALVLVVSAADKPFVTVTAVGHLGSFTPFNYSGAADITVDKTTGQVGVAAADALGVNDFKLWLSNGTKPSAIANALAESAGGAIVTQADAEATGSGGAQTNTFTGTFP